jgi:hypothetical protein
VIFLVGQTQFDLACAGDGQRDVVVVKIAACPLADASQPMLEAPAPGHDIEVDDVARYEPRRRRRISRELHRFGVAVEHDRRGISDGQR